MTTQKEKTIEIKKNHLMIVEGQDEFRFFNAFFKYHNISDIQIIDIGGKTQFKNRIRAVVISQYFHQVKSIGIVRDADDNPQGAFQSICHSLKSAGLNAPTAPMTITDSKPRVAVYICPSQNKKGAIENIILNSVKKLPVMECVNSFIDCLLNNKTDLNPPHNIEKAKVQAFLSSKGEGGIQVGLASEKGYFPLGDPAFNDIKKFINLLL